MSRSIVSFSCATRSAIGIHVHLPPYTPAFNIAWNDICLFPVFSPVLLCLTYTKPLQTERMSMSLNIESRGVRGRGQVEHYFVRQPLASKAFLLQSPCLSHCFCKDGGAYMQTCYSVLHGRLEAAACHFQTPEQLFHWRNVSPKCSCIADSACEAHRRPRMESVAHIQTQIPFAPMYAPHLRPTARTNRA